MSFSFFIPEPFFCKLKREPSAIPGPPLENPAKPSTRMIIDQLNHHYMDYRQKPETIEDYVFIAESKKGAGGGGLYKPKDDKRAMEVHLIKRATPNIAIVNFLSSIIYKELLGFQASEDSILIDKGVLKIKSLFLENFETLAEYPGSDMSSVITNLITKENVQGFERVIAVSLFWGEADPNAGNIGVITNKDGSKFFAKIDHEQSGSLTDEFNVPEMRLEVEYVYGKRAAYGTDLLFNEKMSNACEEMVTTNLQPIYFSIQDGIDKIEQTLTDHPDAINIIADLVTSSLGGFYDSINKIFEPINKKLYAALKNTKAYEQLDDSMKNSIDGEIKKATNEKIKFELIKNYFIRTGGNFIRALLCIYKEKIFSILEIRKKNMQELANVIRLKTAIKNRDYVQFQTILERNPMLLNDRYRMQWLQSFLINLNEETPLIPPIKNWFTKISSITEQSEPKTETLETTRASLCC